MTEHIDRIQKLEEGQEELKVGYHGHDKDIAVLKNNQEKIEKQLEGINSNTKWLVRIAIGFIVGSILTSVFGTPIIPDVPLPK